jgi:nitronate monooxygenase
MITTQLQSRLGIEYPIVGGAMMDSSTRQWVSTGANAGALGLHTSATYKNYDDFRAALRETKDLTERPFGVNINLFPMMEKPDNSRFLEIMAEEDVMIAETSGFAPPADLAAQMKDLGIFWMHKCVGVRYARKAEKVGADAVTVVGYENGGATGNLNVTTLVLVPSTVDAVDIPVIGGGGVVDGRTLLAVLSLGASAAIVGSRLMLSEECPIHANVKQALLDADELQTDVIMRSVGFAHRVWMNEPCQQVAEIEARGGGLDEVYPLVSGSATRKMLATGDLGLGSLSVSQGVGLIRELKPVRQILEDMMAEAERMQGALVGA